MQSEAKRGNPVDARHSSAHSHSSTFRKYWGIHCGQVYKCTECILRGPIVFSGQCNIPLSSIIVSVIETPQEWWSQLCFWSEFLHSGGFPSEPVLCPFPAKKSSYSKQYYCSFLLPLLYFLLAPSKQPIWGKGFQRGCVIFSTFPQPLTWNTQNLTLYLSSCIISSTMIHHLDIIIMYMSTSW